MSHNKLIATGLILAIVFLTSGCVGEEYLSADTSKENKITIKEISQKGLDQYRGQEVVVKGELYAQTEEKYVFKSPRVLKDDSGYWVMLGKSCSEEQREYNYGYDKGQFKEEGDIYIAKGKVKEYKLPEAGKVAGIDCSEPLSKQG